jgi:ureidoacrylate peracid hydrolase
MADSAAKVARNGGTALARACRFERRVMAYDDTLTDRFCACLHRGPALSLPPNPLPKEERMKLKGAVIPDEIVRRVVQRRGSEHCFAARDPARTALVVIDLQHAFMNDAVGHAVVPAARDIVPAVNRLADAVRRSGGGVFWVQMTHDDRCLADWSVAFEISTPAMREKRIAALSEGGLGHQLWPDLDVRPEDEIVKKYRYSGFLPGTSDLADRLRARGFDTVLITGTVTNVCCESSARDANMMNFRTVMVSDGNAALTQAEHEASLTAFYATFGDVMDTDMIIAALDRGGAVKAA